MPFIKVDPEMLGEIQPDDAAGAAMAAGNAAFVPAETMRYLSGDEKIDEIAKATIGVLVSVGATEFRVRYDGGHDEGFAYPDALFFGGKWAPIDVAEKQLARPEIVGAIRKAANSIREDHFRDETDLKVITEAIGWLAETFACQLLGRGYGTGEYSMYGVFIANLKSLELTDDPAAKPPANWNEIHSDDAESASQTPENW